VRILITGFESFDGEPINAAWEVVKDMTGKYAENREVFVRQIPTVFGASRMKLAEAFAEVRPDVVICVGQAGGRSAVSIERMGVNLDDARIPDNIGQQPLEQAISVTGPDGHFSTLPVRHLVETLLQAGIPAEESWSAGTYVCNHLLYGLMEIIKQGGEKTRHVRGGFIHIPYLPHQAARHQNAPSLSVDVVRQALQLVVETL